MEDFVIEEEPTIEATFQMDLISGNHNDLEGRDLPNQHPMDAITGLETALDGKVDKTEESSKVYGTDNEGNQTTYDVGSFGQVDDVQVDGVSVVEDKVANLGTMALENASDYSTKAVADTLYADISYEGTINNHIANKNNPHEVTKAQVGLGNVDNTSDLNKPISTATQTALNGKQNSLDTTQMSAVNSGANATNIGQITTNKNSISSINELIPNEASSSNQLADKEFVNSSISTNTARFIGTFSSVTVLEAYSGTVTNNDYAFVTNSVVTNNGDDWATFVALDAYNKDLLTNFDYGWVINGSKFDLYRFDIVNQEWVSRATNIHKADVTLNSAYNRYKATVASGNVTWEYEYTLNNSSFTASQWAAINSGITSGDVALISTALQPNDNISELTNDSGYLVSSDIATGSANGTISVKGSDVSVYGLGSAAYTDSTDYDASGSASTAETNAKNYADSLASNYATAAQGAKADTAVQPADISNMVTTDTAQNISAKKTFLGEKAILFKQTAATDKLGFTLYDTSNGELGALEYRPNTISGGALINLNTSQSGTSWLGFRYWSNINIIAPKPTNGNYYIPVNVTDGSTTVTSNSAGTLNISTLIPTVNNPTINFTQGGVNKGSFTLNQSTGTTIALESGGSQIDIDNDTITENASNKLQASGVINPQSGNSIKIWQGTESQWTNGEATTWYYWQTPVQAMWTSGGNLSTSSIWATIVYGENTAVVSSTQGYVNYSTNKGESWSSATLPSEVSNKNISMTYGDKFVGFILNTANLIYSSDGINWQYSSSAMPSAGSWTHSYYYNGKYVNIKSNNGDAAYSSDGINWVSSTMPSNTNWTDIIYADDRFISAGVGSSLLAYSLDGETWNSKNLPISATWRNPAYTDGKLVIVGNSNIYCSSDKGDTWTQVSGVNGAGYVYSFKNKFIVLMENDRRILYYSTDGINYTEITLPTAVSSVSSWMTPIISDDMIMFIGYNSQISIYSTDGFNWEIYQFPSSQKWRGSLAGNDIVAVSQGSNVSSIFSSSYAKCFTTDAIPTTSSIVYSAPETSSALTITSVGSGSITLSDTFTYNYTQGGNQFTYRTIGDAHPDWLCNVNGVGVKVGNTMIADNTTPVSSVDSSSTNSDSVGAKLFYDTCGDIETLINAL